MQKLLTLIITAAILYMIFKHNINDIKVPAPEIDSNTIQKSENGQSDSQLAPNVTGNFVEKAISNVLINVLKTDEGKMFFENILQPHNRPLAGSEHGFKINNDNLIEAMFDIKTFGDGEKGPATCGHIVTVNYKILAANNMLIREDTITYPLGSGQIAPGVDAVIVGMKTGQTRHAVISNKYTDNPQTPSDKTESFKFNVLLKEIMPPNFVDNSVRVFDDEIAYKLPLLCGNKAIYHAKITKLSDGTIIYDSKKSNTKLNMQIGNLSYPLIFSHALHNKIPVGSRTVIARGNLFKSFVNDFSSILPETKLAEDEFFMLELSDFEGGLTALSGSLPIQK